LWFDVEAQETSEERKKKNPTPMRKKLNSDGTIFVDGRRRVKKLRMREAQNLGMSECDRM